MIHFSHFQRRFKSLMPAALILSLVGCETSGLGISLEDKEKTVASETSRIAEVDRLVADLNSAIDNAQVVDVRMIIRRLQGQEAAKPQVALANAEIELFQGQYASAAEIFRSLLTVSDVSSRAHQGLGLVLLLVRKPEEAREHLETATKLNPQLWRAWNGLGYYFDLQRNWKRAEQCYVNALDIAKNSPKVLNNLGFSRLMQSRYDVAIADFRTALKMDAGLAVAKTNLRVALAWRGSYAEALSAVAPAELPQALNNVGYIAMLKGEYALAEAYFTRAMEANPAYDAQAASNLRRLDALRSADKVNK